MSSQLTFYAKFLEYIGGGIINLKSDTLKLALVTSDYTPNVGHDVLADVLASPSPEVVAVASPSNGYTQGGKALTGVTFAASDSPKQSVLDADDLTWTALTATFRYGILYANVTVGSVVNPLIAYILFDTTPANIVVNGVDYIVQWDASGILKVSEA